MNTGQVMLSIAAFAFLGTVLVNFNNLILANNEELTNSHDVIIGTSISASYLEAAAGLSYDEIATGQPISNPMDLTDPNALGPDAGETDMALFDDFDDFNGYSITRQADGNNGTFRSDFIVTYVDPEDINRATVQTFIKRLDVKTWRVDIPVTTDTVRMFTTMAYFNFN